MCDLLEMKTNLRANCEYHNSSLISLTKKENMIQRIQTIYLFFASLCGWALFGLPFATATQATQGIFEDGRFNIYDNIGLLVLAGTVSAIALLSIFLFNNRKLQMNIGKVNMILGFGLMAWASYWFLEVINIADFGAGLVMPLLVLILTFLANRNILKDEKLVRSADRLR